jgi:hypothetical protein
MISRRSRSSTIAVHADVQGQFVSRLAQAPSPTASPIFWNISNPTSTVCAWPYRETRGIPWVIYGLPEMWC